MQFVKNRRLQRAVYNEILTIGQAKVCLLDSSLALNSKWASDIGNGSRFNETLHRISIPQRGADLPKLPSNSFPFLFPRRAFSTKNVSFEESATSLPPKDDERKLPDEVLEPNDSDDDIPIEILQAVLTSTEDVYGLDHQLTAMGHLNLAQAYLRTGDHEGEKILKSAEIAWKWVSKNTNDGTKESAVAKLNCLHTLAGALNRMGRPKDALPHLLECLEIASKSSHGEVTQIMEFVTYMMLGDMSFAANEHQKGLLAFGAAMRLQDKIMDPLDPRMAANCRHVAEVLAQAFLFHEAEPMAFKSLEIHRKLRESEGAQSSTYVEEAVDLRLLAGIATGMEAPERALTHLQQARALLVQHGAHLEAALTDVSIGDMLGTLGKTGEALEVYHSALRVQRDVLGDSHPSVGGTLASVSEALRMEGMKEEALSTALKSLNILEGSPSDEVYRLDIANSYAELANTFECLGQLERAVDLVKRSIQARDGSPGQFSIIASLESRLGSLLLSVNKPDEALPLLKSALAKLTESHGPDLKFLATVHCLLGVAILSQNAKFGEKASDWRQEEGKNGVVMVNPIADSALLEFRRARELVEMHPESLAWGDLDVYKNLGEVLEKTGRLDEANECRAREQELRERLEL